MSKEQAGEVSMFFLAHISAPHTKQLWREWYILTLFLSRFTASLSRRQTQHDTASCQDAPLPHGFRNVSVNFCCLSGLCSLWLSTLWSIFGGRWNTLFTASPHSCPIYSKCAVQLFPYGATFLHIVLQNPCPGECMLSWRPKLVQYGSR